MIITQMEKSNFILKKVMKKKEVVRILKIKVKSQNEK